MPGRRGWNGRPPESDAEARRRLLDAARLCVERSGAGRASLQDVAREAGVTRQTVYRYFDDTEDLFRSAAALASGGFLESLRRRVRRERTLADRVVECVVFAVRHIPEDDHLGTLAGSDRHFGLEFLMDLGFVQEEVSRVADGALPMNERELDELAELLLRLLQSFLREPGPRRSERELRTVLRRWLVPTIVTMTGADADRTAPRS